jgi:hypothetical protein
MGIMGGSDLKRKAKIEELRLGTRYQLCESYVYPLSIVLLLCLKFLYHILVSALQVVLLPSIPR